MPASELNILPTIEPLIIPPDAPFLRPPIIPPFEPPLTALPPIVPPPIWAALTAWKAIAKATIYVLRGAALNRCFIEVTSNSY
jgi:hypothetical protein